MAAGYAAEEAGLPTSAIDVVLNLDATGLGLNVKNAGMNTSAPSIKGTLTKSFGEGITIASSA